MSGSSPPDDFPSSLPVGPAFESTAASSSASSDPPPPLPSDLDNPTPNEQLALDAWLRRNPAYINTIPWYRYPSLPILAPLWGYSDADFRAECLESLLFYTSAAGRRLADQERDALLEPITRTAVASSYDRPATIGAAAWLMARSWRKSGLREAAAAAQQQQYHHQPQAEVVGGHITHFSSPQQQQQQQQHSQYQPRGSAARSLAGSLVRRAARASTAGLTCAVGYYALWTPWRFLWGGVEVETIGADLRLEKMCIDMEQNMKNKVSDMLRRHGGL